MVRLVFRPYTQVWRTICTSVTLRASIRVSSDFTLLRHSSPSFGSQQVCSYSNLSQKILVGRCCTFRIAPIFHFHYASRFATQLLAYVLDSLVRVSRRVGWYHFANIPSARVRCIPNVAAPRVHSRGMYSSTQQHWGASPAERALGASVQPTVQWTCTAFRRKPQQHEHPIPQTELMLTYMSPSAEAATS